MRKILNMTCCLILLFLSMGKVTHYCYGEKRDSHANFQRASSEEVAFQAHHCDSKESAEINTFAVTLNSNNITRHRSRTDPAFLAMHHGRLAVHFIPSAFLYAGSSPPALSRSFSHLYILNETLLI